VTARTMNKAAHMTPLDPQDDNKRFATLRAAAAMGGLELLRTNPADGQVLYLGRWKGVVRELGHDLDTAAGFVRIMGGTL
jgi:hypothetical protein